METHRRFGEMNHESVPAAHKHRYAVIDIGTNSVIMLVGDVYPATGTYDTVLDTAEVTQLGQALQPSRQLQGPAINRTCETIGHYLTTARDLGVEQVTAVGTSVLREAVNPEAFIDRAKNAFQLDVEVISGEEEARFSYLSVRTDERFRVDDGGHLILMDIGGGSTELVFGQKAVNTFLSLNLGAVYLTNRFFDHDPPTADEFSNLKVAIEETLSSQESLPTNTVQTASVLVAIGGTAVNLATIKLGLTTHDAKRIHGERLTQQQIAAQIQRFRACTLNERMQIPGLEPKRANVILAGATILQSFMEKMSTNHIDVSTRGVRYGVMYDRFASFP